MLSLAWQKHWIIELSQVKFPFPPSNAIWKNLLPLMLAFLFFTLSFSWNFNWPHSNWDFLAFGLIKYNGFQISGNKSYETPYLNSSKSRNWSYAMFIRETNLKLDLQNFNVFGSSEYEKLDIFLKQILFSSKNVLRLLT